MGVLDFWGRFTAADTDNDGGLNYREFSHLCKLQVEGISDDEIRLVLSQVRSQIVWTLWCGRWVFLLRIPRPLCDTK